MKRSILLLGGSAQQIVAIRAARNLGYRTVLCDYLPDNPGRNEVDVFYEVSTTDKDAVLEVALKEGVSGVLAYASDPAAPTAAFVAEELKLHSIPLWAVETMSDKSKFRAHLSSHGFATPKSTLVSHGQRFAEVIGRIESFSFPLIVKPTDSSGSKGVSVVQSAGDLERAIETARDLSRSQNAIVEEFIENTLPAIIGGDIVVNKGKVEFWGLMTCLRLPGSNPLVPAGKLFPSLLSADQLAEVQEQAQRLVTSLHINFGELNIEILLGPSGKVYFIELGARAGGNFIPLALSDATQTDLVSANVKFAMDGVVADYWSLPAASNIATFVLHSNSDGEFISVKYSDKAASYLYREILYVAPGDHVEPFDGAGKALGVSFFRFPNTIEMTSFMTTINKHVTVELLEAPNG